jgi:hypothetical protein
MAGTTYADIAPGTGDVANSYELILDIYTGEIADLAPGGTVDPEKWLNCPEISALNPKFTDTIKEITNYAYKGSPGKSKNGTTVELSFTVTKRRVAGGVEWTPEYLELKSRADADGEANKIGIRWYDALGASEAYQGVFLVGHPERQGTGDDDTATDQFTLQSDGKVTPITNPNKPVAP